jgi:hypothetical protein
MATDPQPPLGKKTLFKGEKTMFSKRNSVILVLGLMAVLAVSAQAQDHPTEHPEAAGQDQNEKYIELMRQDLNTNITAAMTEGMALTDAQGEIFWPIYRDYRNTVSAIGDRRIALIKDYAENWENLTQEKAAEIMKASFKIQKDRLGLLEKAAKKVAKELDPITAARFVQVERALSMIIDLQVAAEMPLFEEGAGQ